MVLAARSRPAAILQSVLLIAVVITVVVVVIAGTSAPYTLAQRWLVLAPVSLFGAAGWALLVARPDGVPVRAIFGIGIFLTGVTIATLSSSTQTLSLSALWRITTLCGAACGIWVAFSFSRGRAAGLMIVTVLSVTLVAAYALTVGALWLRWMQLGMEAGTIPLRPSLLGGLAPASTLLGDYIVVLVPVGCVVLARAGRAGVAASITLAVFALAEIIVVGARSIWLATAIVAMVLAAAWLKRAGRNLPSRSKVVGIGAIALGVLVLLGIGARSARDLDEGRSSAFVSAISITRDHPLTGSGPGTFGTERLDHAVDRFAVYVLPSALNPMLDSLAETGLVGIVCGIAAVALIGASVIRGLRAPWADRPVAIAAIAGFGAVTIHAQVDSIFDVPGIALAALTMLGFVISRPPGSPRANLDSPRISQAVGVAALVGLFVLLPTQLRLESAVWAQDQATEALVAGDLKSAISHAGDASAAEPAFVPGLVVKTVALDRAGEIGAAVVHAREVIQREDMAQHHLRLALLLEREAHVDEAAREMEAIADRLPVDPLVSINAAAFSARQGDVAGGADRLADAYLSDPSLAGLQLHGELTALERPAYEIATRRLLDRGDVEPVIRLATWFGDTAGARTHLSLLDSEKAKPIAMALDAIDQKPGAVEALQALAAADPIGHGAAAWAWLAAVKTCDLAGAARWQSVTLIATGRYNEDPGETIRVPDGWADREPARYPRAIWGVAPLLDDDVVGTITWTTDLTPVCDQGKSVSTESVDRIDVAAP